MINKSFDNLIDELKAIKLSGEEKSDILARTFSVIESLSIPNSADKKFQPIASPYSSAPWKIYFSSRKFVPSFMIVALLFATGGASLAAEASLPGDSLYGLKVNINEEVRNLTAVSAESKARVAVEATERRLQEVATLSARGQLSEEKKAIVQAQFNKRSTQIKTQVASLVSQNNLTAAQEISVNYESSLKAHEIILEKISSDSLSENKDQHLAEFISTVKTEIATTTVSRVDIQQKEALATTDPKATAEIKLKELRNQTDIVLNLREESKSQLSSTTAALVAGNIAEAQVLTIKAEGYIASSSYSNAILSIQQASSLFSDAESAITTEAGLDYDVKKVINGEQATATSTASTTISII
jgi:hypothetical protein